MQILEVKRLEISSCWCKFSTQVPRQAHPATYKHGVSSGSFLIILGQSNTVQQVFSREPTAQPPLFKRLQFWVSQLWLNLSSQISFCNKTALYIYFLQDKQNNLDHKHIHVLLLDFHGMLLILSWLGDYEIDVGSSLVCIIVTHWSVVLAACCIRAAAYLQSQGHGKICEVNLRLTCSWSGEVSQYHTSVLLRLICSVCMSHL